MRLLIRVEDRGPLGREPWKDPVQFWLPRSMPEHHYFTRVNFTVNQQIIKLHIVVGSGPFPFLAHLSTRAAIPIIANNAGTDAGRGLPGPLPGCSTPPIVLPGFEPGVVDGDSPCRKLVKQLPHSRRYLSLSRYDHSPFQVLPELSGDDLPPIKVWRRFRSDLNERPMTNQRQCGTPVGQRTADDEVIVAMNQNSHHGDLRPRLADRKRDMQSRSDKRPVPARS